MNCWAKWGGQRWCEGEGGASRSVALFFICITVNLLPASMYELTLLFNVLLWKNMAKLSILIHVVIIIT